MKNSQHTTLEEIYLAHKDHVYNYVYRLCGDHDAAQDIVQQTFLKLCNDPNLTSLSHPKAYLFTVARNALYDSWKKKRELRLDEGDEERYQDMATDESTDPGEQVSEDDLRERIDRYLMAMPEKARELMVLRYVEDLSVKEIAHVTSRTLSDVKVGLHRARHRFDAGFTRHLYARVAASRAQCAALGELIAPWGDTDIPVAQLQAIESHIDTCHVCRDDAEDMKRMRKLFAALPLVGVPLALDATLHQAVAAEAMVHGGSATATTGAGAAGGGATSVTGSAGTSAATATGGKVVGGIGAKLAAGAVIAALLSGGGIWLAQRSSPEADAPPVTASPAPTATTTPTGDPQSDGDTVAVNLRARLKRDAAPVARTLRWEIHRLADDGEPPVFVQTDSRPQPRFDLPPGRYRVTVRDGNALASRRIEVHPGKAQDVELILGSGFLRVGARLAAGQALTDEAVRFEVQEGDADLNGKYPFVAYARPGTALSLPAGHYRLVTSLGLNTQVLTAFDIDAGEITTRDNIILDAGYLNLTARHKKDGPPLRENLRFEITAAKPDVSGKYKFVGYAPNGRNVILHAGRYRIVSSWGLNARTVTEVEVHAGQRTVRDDIIVPGGYLLLGARLSDSGAPVTDKLRLEVYAAQAGPDGKYPFIGYAQPGKPVLLAVGRYRVAAHFGLNAGTASEVDVRAGEVTHMEDLVVNGGYLRVIATRNGKTIRQGGLRLEIYDAEMDIRGQRQFVSYIQSGGPGVGLAAGDYFVKANLGGTSLTRSVKVRADETATLSLSFPPE